MTYTDIGIYIKSMARAATTSDVFNAVAEPRRRAILNYLALGERPVNDVVDALELDQPTVSKHLRVLREVGLVSGRREGRQQLYSVNAQKLKTLHDWTTRFEELWQTQLQSIKIRAEQRAQRKKD